MSELQTFHIISTKRNKEFTDQLHCNVHGCFGDGFTRQDLGTSMEPLTFHRQIEDRKETWIACQDGRRWSMSVGQSVGAIAVSYNIVICYILPRTVLLMAAYHIMP